MNAVNAAHYASLEFQNISSIFIPSQKNLVLNLKNNEKFYDDVGNRWNSQNEAANELKLKKNEGFFFGQLPLVEKSPPATDRYINYIICIIYL